MEASLSALEKEVTQKINDDLIRPFTKDEVGSAVFQMGAYKACDRDGYGACFYQKYWSVVGDEVCEAILSFLNSNQDI